MQTATVTTPVMSGTKKCAESPVNPLSRAEARRLGDLHAISLIEEAVKSKSVSIEDVFKVLRR